MEELSSKKQWQRDYYQKNKERLKAYQLIHYRLNKEYISEWHKNHYQEHKERLKAHRRLYYWLNRDAQLAYSKVYYQKHKVTNWLYKLIKRLWKKL